jgi:tetrahydrodipicolinate N-succinyltransferase
VTAPVPLLTHVVQGVLLCERVAAASQRMEAMKGCSRGSLPGKPPADNSPGPSFYCAVIVKTVDAQTRAKTGINELLRE